MDEYDVFSFKLTDQSTKDLISGETKYLSPISYEFDVGVDGSFVISILFIFIARDP
jgi:hypothetical protein